MINDDDGDYGSLIVCYKAGKLMRWSSIINMCRRIAGNFILVVVEENGYFSSTRCRDNVHATETSRIPVSVDCQLNGLATQVNGSLLVSIWIHSMFAVIVMVVETFVGFAVMIQM